MSEQGGDIYLIVNSDDFGLSEGVNEGIIDAHERGIVTSASLMVREKAAAAAAEYAKKNSDLAVGLHVDLGEWFLDKSDGQWKTLYERIDKKDPAAVKAEVAAQIRVFRQLVGKNPTHLDSHQHVHRTSPVTEIVREWGRTLRVPVRHFSKRVRYCGDFYGASADGTPDPERISMDALIRIINSLQPGVTEVLCHAGDDLTLATVYREQRKLEVMALTDPSVKRAIREKGAKLVSFATYPRPRKKASWIDRAAKMFLKAVES